MAADSQKCLQLRHFIKKTPFTITGFPSFNFGNFFSLAKYITIIIRMTNYRTAGSFVFNADQLGKGRIVIASAIMSKVKTCC